MNSASNLKRSAPPTSNPMPYALSLCLLIFPFPLFSPYRYAPCAEQSESKLQRTTDN